MQNQAFKTAGQNNFSTQTGHGQKILLVDDDRTLRAVLNMQLEQLGYSVIEATNGQEAFDTLQEHKTDIDVILLDREMPVMDGMQFIAKIKANAELSRIPVIMVTGSGQPAQISQGIEAGVFYYLVKPIHYNVLSTIVSTAMRDASRKKKLSTVMTMQSDAFKLMTSADFHVTTPLQAENLAAMLANCYDDPARVFPGIAELILNGIEHGNLAIGFEEKGRLLATDSLAREINTRLMRAENINKEINVEYRKTATEQKITITDQGKGFDWTAFLHLDPDRVTQMNGRGIATAKMQSFDDVTYNDCGNQVTATIRTM
jgi:two-component system cell cycle response regulator